MNSPWLEYESLGSSLCSNFLVLLLSLWRPCPLQLGNRSLRNQRRTFIYSLLTKGRPFPALIFLRAAAFCTGNGVLQAYYLIYCAEYPEEWYTDARFCFGVLLFVLGMGVNIHSDHLLRQLRKPGEVTYKIPQGGLFTYVSGANYLGEIIEWMGYALAAWSVPALAFAFFSLCFLGIRAFNHHRFYLKMFKDYPKSRKALIPFIF
ncbi:3-oxo-5-alpha-steroid 4-dehydrogenase 2 isoform X3 [Meriones unguiculatus]|uniref:3-oxo-5-alpha-steroid 4-dehydrogenase 2 isoform X3 n=1 Tax=Meriones unguiculatus TaxID=10047 RepID=UPI00293ED14C|nr:3-oxo-5-alpha-steroid 4-dehydrogenase 2 isoform X3 [Meriones unguiculatus]